MSFSEVISLFCQVSLLLLFTFSAAQKWRDHLAFQQTLESFTILPAGWIAPLARLTICAESLIAVLLLGGLVWHGVSLAGIIFALVLLLIFTGALVSVVTRGLQVSCGCFGADLRPVSPISLVRNTGLVLCCMLAALPSPLLTSSGQDFAQILLTVPGAATFVLLWINLDEIVLGLRLKTA